MSVACPDRAETAAPDDAVVRRAIAQSLTTPLDVGVATAHAALARLDLARPGVRALRGLGLTDRVASAAVDHVAGGPLVLDLALRLASDDPTVHATVEVGIEPSADDRSLLTIATRFSAADDDAHAELQEAWPVIGAVADGLARRAARTVKAYAEEDLAA